MMARSFSWKALFIENQIVVVLLGLLAGLSFPTILKPIAAFSTALLILIFYFSSLRISVHEIRLYAKDWRLMTLANAFKLVILPMALFMPVAFLARQSGSVDLQDWALALLIMSAVPTGMTIALIADFIGGVTSLALVLTATTSLLAPLTVPLVFKLTVDAYVPIPVLNMFGSLFVTIVLPFIAAAFTKRHFPVAVAKGSEWFRGISTIAFGVLIAGLVAQSSGGALEGWSWRDVVVAGASLVWMGALTWAAYRAFTWRRVSERLTVALCFIYMNNTLALFVAAKYFSSTHVMPKLILLLLGVNALLLPIKREAKRLFLHRRHE